MNPVSARLSSQQLIRPEFSRPEELVRWMGAVQGQEYRMMRWAVAIRTKKPSAKEFKKSYDEGKIIRQHLLRGTWQLIPGEDAGWMTDLFGPKAEGPIRGWIRNNKVDISGKYEEKVRDILACTASDLRSATKEDFSAALEKNDIRVNNQVLGFHICLAELKGVLCSGDLLPLKQTYSYTPGKLGHQDKIDKDEAILRITKRYFQSRQPASLEDFVWWSGLNVSDCRKGISMLGDWLHIENIAGHEFYLTDECRTNVKTKGEFLLLPPYDEYLIGYKSRDIVMDKEFTHKAHNNSGNFYPIIIHDGIVCGNWSPFKDDIQPILFDPFKELTIPDDIYSKYQRFLSQ